MNRVVVNVLDDNGNFLFYNVIIKLLNFDCSVLKVLMDYIFRLDERNNDDKMFLEVVKEMSNFIVVLFLVEFGCVDIGDMMIDDELDDELDEDKLKY